MLALSSSSWVGVDTLAYIAAFIVEAPLLVLLLSYIFAQRSFFVSQATMIRFIVIGLTAIHIQS